MKINVMQDVLQANDRIAEENRQLFEEKHNLVLNLMSSPGAGKTSLLERTAERVAGKLRLGVIVGDIETTRDADRIGKFNIPAIQLTTGTACHLDANMVASALPHLKLDNIDILVVENVGNLVCPAEFIVGEDYKIMILSVTEGDEKPLKYPLMFRESALMLINKIDLLQYTNFSLKEARANALKINPDIDIIEISCTNGAGLDEWVSWLTAKHRDKTGGAGHA
ncbi:MAG: hydrogenase nickel incorporation protein HypB [Dehalococcoidia bacterium]|nr:hydrogenase nickel incorporation protein HypB [Dehalococcoidia bacterium]MDD5647856.1 hydrogenase nickel incorporation protein HypB [Dehalococcoidia bacterium]